MKKQWTINDITILYKLKKQGMSIKQLSKYFNVTENAIRKIFQRKKYKADQIFQSKFVTLSQALKYSNIVFTNKYKYLIELNKIRIKNNLPILHYL